MHKTPDVGAAIAGLKLGVTTSAKPAGAAKLTAIHRETTDQMPQGGTAEVRVLIATLDPGDRTPYHSHRFPVTVYVMRGAFTLELDDRPPVTIKAGEAFVEPAHVRMTGRNLSTDEPTSMALFFVAEPDTPFADPA